MPRRPTNARIAALASALAAGALAAFALRPSTTTTGSAAHVSQQAAEVRTQVIRRTVHIVRHERPPRPRATGRRGTSGSVAAATGVAAVSAAPRTGASGSHSTAAAVGAPVAVSAPRTRTSGASTGAAPLTGSTVAPVRTRTSGGATGGGAVRTRTSGGGDGGDHQKGRDD